MASGGAGSWLKNPASPAAPRVEEDSRHHAAVLAVVGQTIPKAQLEFELSPAGVASSYALGLFTQLRDTNPPAGEIPSNVYIAPDFFSFPLLREALNMPEPKHEASNQ